MRRPCESLDTLAMMSAKAAPTIDSRSRTFRFVWPERTSRMPPAPSAYIARSGVAHRIAPISYIVAFRAGASASRRMKSTAVSGSVSCLRPETDEPAATQPAQTPGKIQGVFNRNLTPAYPRPSKMVTSSLKVSRRQSPARYTVSVEVKPHLRGARVNRMYDPVPGGLMLTVKRTLPIALTIVAGCLWQRPAVAQDKLFYLDRAQISGAPDDGYMVWRPYLHEKTRFYGQLSLGYSHNPLRASAATSDTRIARNMSNPVEGQFLSYLSIGTEVGGLFSFNISQPISLYTLYG